MRVFTILKCLILSEPLSSPPSSIKRWVFGLKKRLPLMNVPFGITMTPPPS